MSHSFDLRRYLSLLDGTDQYWTSFLELPGLEVGVMRLEAGEDDIQHPHASDEVYFIISGNGFLSIDGTDYEVVPHHALIVPKGTPHWFHSNTEPIIAYYVLN